MRSHNKMKWSRRNNGPGPIPVYDSVQSAQLINRKPSLDGTVYDERWDLGTNRPPLAGAYSVLGGTEYLDVGDISASIKTISCWIRPDDITSHTDYLIDLNGADYITIVNGTVTVNGFAAATVTIYVDGVESSTIPDTGWHHVLIVSDTGFSASDLDIGRVGGSGNYSGDVHEPSFWVNEPDADERTWLMTFGQSGDDPGIANCKCWIATDQIAGTTYYDRSGNGKPAAMINSSPSVFGSGSDLPAGTFGSTLVKPYQFPNEVGYSRRGIYSYGDILDDTFAEADGYFEVEAEITVDDSATNRTIVGKAANVSFGEDQQEFLFRLTTTHELTFYYVTTLNGTKFRVFQTDDALTPGQSYTVKAVYDGSQADGDDRVTIYVDGVSVATTITATGGTINASDDIQDGTAPLAINAFVNTAEDDFTQDGIVTSSVTIRDDTETIFAASSPDWIDTIGDITPTVIRDTILPRDESDTANDVLESPLDYVGKSHNNGQFNNMPCATLAGTEYISATHLTGSETVTSSGGTSTPSVSAGRVDFTAGTCWDLVLSDGTRYVFCENEGDTVYDVSVDANGDPNSNHGTWQNATTSPAGTGVHAGRQSVSAYCQASGCSILSKFVGTADPVQIASWRASGEFELEYRGAFEPVTSCYIFGGGSNDWFRYVGGEIRMEIDNNLMVFACPYDLEDGEFHKIKLTRDALGDVRIYIDDVESTTGAINQSAEMHVRFFGARTASASDTVGKFEYVSLNDIDGGDQRRYRCTYPNWINTLGSDAPAVPSGNTFTQIPALADGSVTATVGTIERPPGDNGAVGEHDPTGGIDYAGSQFQTDDLELADSTNTEYEHRRITTDNGVRIKADRYVALTYEPAGSELTQIENYTQTQGD